MLVHVILVHGERRCVLFCSISLRLQTIHGSGVMAGVDMSAFKRVEFEYEAGALQGRSIEQTFAIVLVHETGWRLGLASSEGCL